MSPKDAPARRGRLVTTANPGTKLDYVIRLEGAMRGKPENNGITVDLRYVPDRVIIEPESFGRYLDALGEVRWGSLEETAVAILDDVNNQVVARWIRLTVDAPGAVRDGAGSHGVMLEDRQPHWENETLLSHLRRY